MAKTRSRAGRPRAQGKRTASGRISRAGKVDKGTIEARARLARPLLGPDDRVRLDMLVQNSPARLAQLARTLDRHDKPLFRLDLGTADKPVEPDEAVRLERERLFAIAAGAEHAAERRDPVGRAWHAGLLAGHGVDAAALRDIGRQYGFLYWHEYRSVDATVGGYSDMVAMGSVRLGADIGRDGLGLLWKTFSAIVDPMGRKTREALHRLCVNDMWFAEGPDWLDRLLAEADAKAGRPVAGALPGAGDRETMRLAVSALVALARGGARERPARAHPFEDRPVKRCARCRCPLGNDTAESSLYSPREEFEICVPCFEWEESLIEETGTNEHPDVVAAYGNRPPPLKDVDPRFLNERGFMRPWSVIAKILRGEALDEEDEAA